MKYAAYLSLGSLLLVSACGGNQDELSEKKSQLQEYRAEAKELKSKIASLEEAIAAQDSTFGRQDKATLVTTLPVSTKNFEHFLEVRGSVESEQNVTMSAEAPGVVERILVQEGDQVKRGQVLMTQDSETIRRNIEELKTSLELATTVYERQKNLWDQKIGTEIQFLQAKNNKESLERRIASAQSQLGNYIIRAPFAGSVDNVIIKEGEMAQPGLPLLRLVSLQDMHIEADVSEAYLGKFAVGDSVQVTFPSLNKTITSTISAVGQVIDQNNRTFSIEVKLPSREDMLRPNLLAVVKIKDFEQQEAIVVPTNLILNDNQGDFVYAVQENGGVAVATKKPVKRGLSYEGETLVESGLSAGDRLVDEGFRNVAEGTQLKVTENPANTTTISYQEQ